MEQIVGVDESFHQNVGLAFAHHRYRTVGSIVAVGSLNKGDVVSIAHQLGVGFHLFLASHKNGFHEPHFQSSGHRLLRVVVSSPDNSHPLAHSLLRQMNDHVFKTPYDFHSLLV